MHLEPAMNATVNSMSCEECRRRKQRCNKLFPCQNCSKREIAHLCRFVARASKASKASDSRHDFEPSR